MADQVSNSPPTAAKNEEPKKPGAGGGNRGGRRPSQPKQPQAAAGGGLNGNQANAPSPRPTPSPRPGNRRASSTADSGSESGNRREGGSRRNEGRGGGRGGGRAGGRAGNRSISGGNRPAQGRNNSGNKKDETTASPGQIAPPAASGSSEALTRLQGVIADLKSAPAPAAQTNTGPTSNTPPASSTLPPTAPPFQPSGMLAANLNNAAASAQHRKAASLGVAPGLSSNFNLYTPQFGGMMEEEGALEEGEIRDPNQPQASRQQTHQPRAQSQNFTAPRFAALAAQQQQDAEILGPSGRPQLAPGFSFGARRQASGAPIAPPINEEDVGFQFPQQVTPQVFDFDPSQIEPPRRNEPPRPEFNGIMAEQIAIQNQIEALQQQQQALYQHQLASNQILSFQTPGLAPARSGAHRRVQSTVPGMGAGPMGSFATGAPIIGQLGGLGGLNLPGAGIPIGHGRRHSVNVVNKPNHNPMASLSYGPGGFPSDGYDDGFAPPAALGGHSRQVSRADSTWRINGGVGGVGVGSNTTAELANAQAQLQSLQQFRAAAGGHHAKMASFSFPNMLPNMMAANLMGVGNVLAQQQQQHQQFQQQLQQSNQPQRKSLFAPYLPQASLPPLLAAGKLVVGILRVNKRNRSDAYVATEVLDADIYICGSKDRNRALEGDIVAVELLDVDEVWSTKKEKEEKKRKKEENAAYEPKGSRKDDKKKDDVEVEGQGLMLFEDEEVTDEVKPQFAGHVVAVVERMPGQLFSGTLGLLRPSSAATKEKQEAERREREGDKGDEPRRAIERPKIVWFKPTDKRVPLIAIPTEQAPPDFVENSESYADKLFVACIKRHPISSLHPFGTLVEELGPIGDIEVETSALLKDCNFPSEDFTDNVIKCLPPIPWTIPEHELEARKDLRQDRIFTIDPQTAKDLDDALSVKHNDDGTYDIGVHIADVSHFVKPNTALDRDAKKRATSVYLVQRAVPMLPPTLCEELCSLVPGHDRLTFSVVFTFTKEGKITNKWFGKTMIRSAGKLSYENAQDVIEGQTLGGVAISPEHDAVDVAHDIKILHGIAQQLRDRRFKSGILALESVRTTFKLDAEGRPVDCATYARRDAHKLVEEFMLLANIAVAQQIAVHLPEQALLRRHDSPIDRRLQAFALRADKSGYPMDISSAGALMKSFNDIADPLARRIIEMRFYKTTGRAKYFCTGMLDIAKYGHYALNVPLYTHFTSPIRRYADILVHRQLEAVLSGGSDVKFTMDRDAVAKIAQQCNIKRDSAKLAQEQSAHLFLCVLIADLTQRYGPVIRPAKVVGVLDAAFDVLVPEFGIEKRVHIDQMPIDNHVYDERSSALQIYWSNKDVLSWLAENSDDEHLKKMKRAAELHAQKMEVTTSQAQDESALFDEDDEDDKIVLGREEPAPETSEQRLKSMQKVKPTFEGLKDTAAGHKIQEIKEQMTVPVIITADLTKSPPVIKVYSVNPYAA